MAANNITATSAEISWTGNADATGYNLRYRESGAGTGVGTAISSSANARLDNASTGNQISINNGNQV